MASKSMKNAIRGISFFIFLFFYFIDMIKGILDDFVKENELIFLNILSHKSSGISYSSCSVSL